MAARTMMGLTAVVLLAVLAGAPGPFAYGAGYVVGIAAVTVGGVRTQVLTDTGGLTLYYRSTDTPAHSTCTGTCTQVWVPLLASATPTFNGSLSGKFNVVSTANGSQVSYNGHLLYRYAGDTVPGQANGQGLAGQWWIARVDLPPTAPAGSSSPNRVMEHNEGGGMRDSGGTGGMGGR